MESYGIIVKSPAVPEPFTSKVILLAGTCDLPAKNLMMNIACDLMGCMDVLNAVSQALQLVPV